MPWARASALARHLRCPAAAWLPRWDRDAWTLGYLGGVPLPLTKGATKDTRAADWGTAMHDAKSNNAEACDPWLTAIDSVREKFWPQALGLHEQCYSYNCETGVVEVGPANAPILEMNAWKNSRALECVTGTADWAGTLPSGEGWVDDLKTGWKVPPVNTEPMLFYSLCQARATPALDTSRLSITHYPRVKNPGPDQIRRYWLQITKANLDEFEKECQTAWRRTRVRGLSLVKPGPHCQYCPSESICPGIKE